MSSYPLSMKKTGTTRAGPFTAQPDAATLVHNKVLSLLLKERTGLILDVPAGEGAFAASARKHGYEVQCGDIDPSRFKVDGIDCWQVDLNQGWPCDDELFDYVVSIEAIEHLENPWHVTREAHRVLKTNGQLFITTPNVLGIKSRLSYLLYGYPNYFHYMIERRFDGREESSIDHINPVGFLELRYIFSMCGFQIEAIETNRYVKQHSVLSRLLKLLLHSRGRSHVRNNLAKARVRQTLLSPTLLFGEILIVKARKVIHTGAAGSAVRLQAESGSDQAE